MLECWTSPTLAVVAFLSALFSFPFALLYSYSPGHGEELGEVRSPNGFSSCLGRGKSVSHGLNGGILTITSKSILMLFLKDYFGT